MPRFFAPHYTSLIVMHLGPPVMNSSPNTTSVMHNKFQNLSGVFVWGIIGKGDLGLPDLYLKMIHFIIAIHILVHYVSSLGSGGT